MATAFFLVPEGLIDVGGYLKNNIDRGIAQGVFNTRCDEFQLNQLASVFISGLRELRKDNLSIIDRTSENLLRLLGVSPAKASTILDEAKVFYH